jgi:hypothetical protein
MANPDSTPTPGASESNRNCGEAGGRREIPGGDHPARTPGATGPTTREVERALGSGADRDSRAEESDVNEQLVGRARLGDVLKRPLDSRNPGER